MNFRGLTWPQVVLVLGAGALILVAYKLFGAETATVITLVTHALAAMSSGKPPSPPAAPAANADEPPRPPRAPPAGPFVALACAALVACAPWTAPDVQRLRVGERKLDVCEDFATSDAGAGADANADEIIARFRACRAEAGIP